MTTPDSIFRTTRHYGWLAVALTAVCLAATVWFYTVDDAYIVFRYARNILAGDGAVFNPGNRVEGFTSPLWLGVSVIAEATPWLGAAGMCKSISLVILLAFFARVSVTLREGHRVATLALLLLATHGPLLGGLVGGLESGANAILIAWLLVCVHDPRADWREHAIIGTLVGLSRPENALLLGVHICFLLLLRWKRTRADVARAALVWAVAAVALLALRRVYYHAWIPNTAIAKLGGETDVLASGFAYIGSWFRHYGWIAALGVLPLVFRRSRAMAIHGWLLVAAQIAFVLLAGGDWMPQWRFMLPVAAVLLTLGAVGLGEAVDAGTVATPPHPFTRRTFGCAVTITILAVLQVTQFRVDRWNLDLYQRQLVALDAGPIEHLRRHARPGDAVAARDIGLLGYATDARIIDLVGLTDSHIARTSGLRRRDALDRDYVFARSPRFVLLQSERRDDGRIAHGRLSSRLKSDDRFGAYAKVGRWELPGGHFCDLFERSGHDVAAVVAMQSTGDD